MEDALPSQRHRRQLPGLSRELPFIVVSLVVIVLCIPLLGGLTSDHSLVESLTTVRNQWLPAALADLAASAADGTSRAQTNATTWIRELEKLLDGANRLARFSPALTTELNALRRMTVTTSSAHRLGTAELAARIARADMQFTRVRDQLRELEQGRDYAYSSVVLFLVILLLAFVASYRFQASRFRDERLRHATQQRMNRLELAVQERERRRIARELHDQTAQNMALARMTADHLPPGPDTDRLRQMLSEALGDIRSACEQLRLPEEVTHSPRHMVEELCASAHVGYRLLCHVSVSGSMQARWDHETSLHVYRMVQEALANARRHSGTGVVWLTLDGTAPKRLQIAVEDRGSGLQGAHEGQGRRGMRERAQLIGGDVAWETPEGGGTRVRITVPRTAATKDEL